MAKLTNEILNILAKGQFKSGFNPLAAISGIIEGDLKEAIFGGLEFSATTAAYTKAGRICQKTESIEMNCSQQETVELVKQNATKIKKRLIPLKETPSVYPYIAYFHKGIFANPTVVVVVVEGNESESMINLTAFTTKVGFIKRHSLNVAIRKFEKFI